MKKKTKATVGEQQTLRNLAEKINQALSGYQQVCSKSCDQCLFTKNKIVSDEAKAEILAKCEKEQTHFVCHKGTEVGENVVCNGFFRLLTSPYLDIMKAGKRIKLIPPDQLKESNKRSRPKKPPSTTRSPRKRR